MQGNSDRKSPRQGLCRLGTLRHGDSSISLAISRILEVGHGPLMANFDVKKLAVPSVCLLISFLAYSSQVLFLYLDPCPLTGGELFRFNSLVSCIWVCYANACRTNPGAVPSAWIPQAPGNGAEQNHVSGAGRSRSRWCRKCKMVKPPRAHHCKTCGRFVFLGKPPWISLIMTKRCIPKMDHHCPWTSNCVSYFTFPHFLRFLFYSVASMLYLERLIFLRGAVLWKNRNMPSVGISR